jgi:glycosyltransferase involved in cell wall biosynthesis
VAATGAAELVEPNDPQALHAALAALLADPDRRAALAAKAREAAATTYAWDGIAEQHRAVYGMLRRS